MDPAIVSAMAAVLGSLAGGSATVASAWVAQTKQGKRELMHDEINRRQTLYGEFIAECSKLLVDALGHELDALQKLVPLYDLLNRIRLCASDAVLTEAEGIVRRIGEQYFEPNLSVQDLRTLFHSMQGDPLRSFGEACRIELRSMRSAL
jgi:hypothetical protein